MTTEQLATRILNQMGGNAHDICTGDCTTFAKSLITAAGRGQIVSNLSDEMLSELDGFEVIAPETYFPNPNRRADASHCWAKIDGKFYDAFNPEGVDEETELQFYIDNIA